MVVFILILMLQLFIITMLSCGPTQPPVNVYLTFDDGPGPGSDKVYCLADSEKVKINLFVIGKRALRGDSICHLFQRHRTDSFLLFANHSYSHADGHYKLYYEDPAGVLKDFDNNRDTLGLDNSFARMPGRNYWRIGTRKADDIVNGKEAADSLVANGYNVFGWDMEWKCDSPALTATGMLDKIEWMIRNKCTFTPGNIVILLHDQELENAAFREEVRSFIRLAKSKAHFRIDHLTGYPLKYHAKTSLIAHAGG
jgi:peptidoglycan/xylan/chitin deacetylase (PgdA/CDA1 family)